jgi:hypothetical protein
MSEQDKLDEYTLEKKMKLQSRWSLQALSKTEWIWCELEAWF